MKRETLRHPKTYDLAARLKCSRPEALGFLTLLWDFCSESAPAGDIGKWPDGAIARGCDWPGDPADFVLALVDSGWLDRSETYRLVIHDIHIHAEQWWRQKLTKLGMRFVTEAVAPTVRTVEGTELNPVASTVRVASRDRTSVSETETETEGFAEIQKPDWPDLDSILGTESPLQDSGIEATSVWELLKTPEKLRDPQAIHRWHRWQLASRSPVLGPERFWQAVLLALALKLTKSSRVKNPKGAWIAAICKSRFKQARAFVPQAIELLKPIWAAADSQGGQS